MYFFDQTTWLCEAMTGGKVDANGVDSRKVSPSACTLAGTAVV